VVIVTWEMAQENEYPILAYRCFDSSLPIFKYRKQSIAYKGQNGMTLFDNVEIDVPNQDEIETGERRYYRMRLPYTRETLMNRLENGSDVPEWFLA
jgi:hypothetical protein